MASVTEKTEAQLESVCREIKGRKKTRENKRTFLRNYFRCNCRVTPAAAASNIGRRTVYKWRSDDSKFVDAMDAVQELFQGHLESLIIDECEEGSERLLSLAARKLIPEYADDPPQQITNVAIVNPDRSHAERLQRTKEVMQAIGFTVTDEEVGNVIEGTARKQIEQ